MRISGYFIIIILCITQVSAHQLRYPASDDVTIITNPVVSQAFYAELKGMPQYYIINEIRPFDLYVQLLVINISDVNKQFVVTITQDKNIVAVLDNTNASWTLFHDSITNDDYWNGPEIRFNATGNYTITVTDSNLRGKYVLVVGEKESFPLSEIITSTVILPSLKLFMGKSLLLAYWNLVGLFLLIVILIIVAGIYFILRKRHKKTD